MDPWKNNSGLLKFLPMTLILNFEKIFSWTSKSITAEFKNRGSYNRGFKGQLFQIPKSLKRICLKKIQGFAKRYFILIV